MWCRNFWIKEKYEWFIFGEVKYNILDIPIIHTENCICLWFAVQELQNIMDKQQTIHRENFAAKSITNYKNNCKVNSAVIMGLQDILNWSSGLFW